MFIVNIYLTQDPPPPHKLLWALEPGFLCSSARGGENVDNAFSFVLATSAFFVLLFFLCFYS